MDRPTRILLLEDNPADAQAMLEELRHAGLVFVHRRVATRTAFVEALIEFSPDVVLVDCVVPGFDVLSALRLARLTLPAAPVIVVTGVLADPLIANLLNAGALDYLLKDRLARLGSAVRRALALRDHVCSGARAKSECHAGA